MKTRSFERVYVQVGATFDQGGHMFPRVLIWEDGRKYPIERVLDVRPAPSLRAGGMGDRYTVRVGGHERYLYFERTNADDAVGRWFVEKPTAN